MEPVAVLLSLSGGCLVSPFPHWRPMTKKGGERSN